jgi:hypothetical protein
MAERESPYLWSVTAADNDDADPSINFAERQLPSTLNNSNRAKMAADARHLKDTNGSLTTGGAANAQTLTINGTQTAYANGHTYSFKAGFSNTGSTSLNITNADGAALGVKALVVFTITGEALLSANMIRAGGHYIVQYNAAVDAGLGGFVLLNPTLDYVGSELTDFLVAELTPVACFCYMSANQGPVATDTTIAFDTVEFNYGSAFDTGTNTFTCPTDGVYEVTVKARYQSATIADTDLIGVSLTTAGSGGPNFRNTASGTLDQDVLFSIRRSYVAGTTLKPITRTTGASKTVVAGTATAPASFFAVRRVFSDDLLTFVGL